MKIGIILLSLFLCSTAWAKDINVKYSFKGFPYHNLSFKDRPVSEFNNTIIKGSCFYQEWVEGDKDVVKDIFPDGMTGVTFERCNLDNILVPVGNTVIGGCYRKIKIQNDLADWELDTQLKPTKCLNDNTKLPKDIPSEKVTIN